MYLKLYKVSDRPEKANKSLDSLYDVPADGTGILFEDTSSKSPVISIKASSIDNIEEYNYAYIPKFKRYYFVEHEYLTKGQVRLHLTTDLLTTAYHTKLASTDNKTLFQDDRWAYLERSETNYNNYFNDTERFKQLAYNYPKVYNFPNQICSKDANYYYIQTTGGNLNG